MMRGICCAVRTVVYNLHIFRSLSKTKKKGGSAKSQDWMRENKINVKEAHSIWVFVLQVFFINSEKVGGTTKDAVNARLGVLVPPCHPWVFACSSAAFNTIAVFIMHRNGGSAQRVFGETNNLVRFGLVKKILDQKRARLCGNDLELQVSRLAVRQMVWEDCVFLIDCVRWPHKRAHWPVR